MKHATTKVPQPNPTNERIEMSPKTSTDAALVLVAKAALGDVTGAFDDVESLLSIARRHTCQAVPLGPVIIELEKAKDALFAARVALDELGTEDD